MSASGTVSETYLAALQHDLAGVTDEETLVGVVRRPTRWFLGSVDENYPELGPPPELLDAVRAHRDDYQTRGLCEEGAHNAAWEDTDFEERYRDHLESTPEAGEALAALAARVRDGEDVVLVCFEGEGKRCHRHLLREELEAAL
ncbi:DUF488 family protein, N3 subclade [Halomarina ordinaria]|uniref:DUF488 family protein n=1 Tax=Halomarina ordinaria TaxID=3033939 RepID=A0ABD5U5F7_9EURY|nr:DUF488 family protein [Halomarina sp. PSRA2]